MPPVSFFVPKAWVEMLKAAAEKKGGMGRLVVEAIEELIARYKQPEVLPGRPRSPAARESIQAPPAEARRRRRVRSAAASGQECSRCCQLAAEAERWWQKYLEHLINRAKSERGGIFSIVVTRDIRRLFSVEVCPHLASYFTARLHETGCVKEVLARGKGAKRYGYRLVLDKRCIASLQAKDL